MEINNKYCERTKKNGKKITELSQTLAIIKLS